VRQSGWLREAGRYLRRVAVIDLAILVIVGAICWAFGWRTAQAYGTALLVAGVAIVGAGLLGMYGGMGRVRSFTYQHSMSASTDGLQRARESVRTSERAYAFVIEMGLIALGPLVVGWLIQALLG
jgi:hypothetical protein